MTPDTSHTIDAEIFSVGEWNGETFTREDLEEIAANFERLRGVLQPPLKFGHDDSQTLLGQQDGDPALGWVQGLRVVGDRLVATFAGMPSVVLEAIRNGRYRRVSAELYFNVRRGGEALGKALKAVALLGADLPAVTNLRDLTAFLHAANATELQPGEARVFTMDRHDPPAKERCMPSTPDIEELQTELQELRAYREQQEQRKQQEHTRRRTRAFQQARDSVATFCEEQVAQGRLTPHLRERLLREVEQQVHTFSDGAGLRVSMGWLRDFIAAQPVVLPQAEAAHAGHPGGETEPAGDPSRTLARRAAQRMVEMNLSYSQAAEYVLKTDPELARAYRDFTLNP